MISITISTHDAIMIAALITTLCLVALVGGELWLARESKKRVSRILSQSPQYKGWIK
jgi:hypothetical protein